MLRTLGVDADGRAPAPRSRRARASRGCRRRRGGAAEVGELDALAGETSSSPAFGFASAAQTRASASGWSRSGVAARPEAAAVGREAQLLAVAPRDRLAALEEERDLDRVVAVQPLRQLARVLAAAGQPVDHPGAVRRGHDDVVGPDEALLERDRALDAGLAVVGADETA